MTLLWITERLQLGTKAERQRVTIRFFRLSPLTFCKAVDLYRFREQPGRSNYFFHLISALSNKSQSEKLTVNALIGYLGGPDESDQEQQGPSEVFGGAGSERPG